MLFSNLKSFPFILFQTYFIHKIKIALKELEKTVYWIDIGNNIDSYPKSQYLIDKLFEIRKILTKIISTSKSNIKTN